MQLRLIRMTAWIWLAVLCCVVNVRATQLTFDIYNDADKTSWIGNGPFVPQTYGDNVNDFNPTNSFGGKYYDYGSAGGLTPNITVSYRYHDSTNPANNAEPGGQLWESGYGDLDRAVYPESGFPYYAEIRFTAALGYRVTISNFHIAAFGSTVNNQTLKVVRDAGTANAATLWQAGPDGTVSVSGSGHTTYMPNVLVADGHTISLIYGTSGNIAVDDIIFIQSIPEPTALSLGALAIVCTLLRKRRGP